MRHLQYTIAVFLIGFTGCGPDQSSGPDVTAPAFVRDLNAVAISDSALLVTWTAPGDDGTRVG